MTEVACNDTAIAPCSSDSDLARATITLAPGKTYRATIYAKNLGTLTNVTWSYLFSP